MIYLDAHVHIQKRFSLDTLLLSAFNNFDKVRVATRPHESATYCLLLTEIQSLDYFSALVKQARQQTGPLPSAWQIKVTEEKVSVLLRHQSRPDISIFVVAGRQIVTKERLEVLALATLANTDDGKPLADTVDEVRAGGGLAVLPWGAGKWLGKRGEIVVDFFQNTSPQSLFAGDNGGRPVFWRRPAAFDLAARRGIRLLPGSDPLPLFGEESRVGSYGAMVDGDCSAATPASDLKKLLLDSSKLITPFGKNQGAWQFFKTQFNLRRDR